MLNSKFFFKTLRIEFVIFSYHYRNIAPGFNRGKHNNYHNTLLQNVIAIRLPRLKPRAIFEM